MTEKRIKVGLVGCGQIADAHLQQIRRIPWAAPVAVCDLEPLLARQAAERFDRSEAARTVFGDAFVDHFAASRVWECREYERHVNSWQLDRYFEII